MDKTSASFNSGCQNGLNTCLSQMMLPFSWLTQHFLSYFRSTSRERRSREEDPCYERYVILSFLLPCLLISVIVTLPLFVLAFCIWAPLQQYRRPYRCYFQETLTEEQTRATRDPLSWTIASVDTCLYPEFESRHSNLSDTQTRARQIANAICESLTPSVISTDSDNADASGKAAKQDTKEQDHLLVKGGKVASYTKATAHESEQTDTSNETLDDLQSHIISSFPSDLQVVCLQGVFDHRAHAKLVNILKNTFAYVVCDATDNSWESNRYGLGSGLIVASRLPVLDVDFRVFISKCSNEKFKSKGALMAKVRIGQAANGEPVIALVTNVHLQQGQGQEVVTTRCEQLSELQGWVANFLSRPMDGHVVADILCGNLGFDTSSTDDKENWTHPLVESYSDPCQQTSGKDRPWAMGTELVQQKIYKDDVATPGGMKSTLSEKGGAERFLHDVFIRDDITSPDVITLGGRRRTQHIMYRKTYKPATVEAGSYRFITRLATLSVHLPVAATLHAPLPRTTTHTASQPQTTSTPDAHKDIDD